MNDDNEQKNAFLGQYGGAIIGGFIALLLCFTEIKF